MGRHAKSDYKSIRPICKTCLKRTTDFEYVNGAVQCRVCINKIAEKERRSGKSMNQEYYRQLRKSMGLSEYA